MRRHPVLRAIRMKKPEPANVCALVLAVFFLCGGMIGNACSINCGETLHSAFRDYLLDYCLLYGRGGVDVSLFQCALLYFGNVSIAFLSGFSSLGVISIPLLSAVFGFASFYTVSCFIQAFGSAGIGLAAALLVLRLIFTIPCFFLVAGEAMPFSLRLAVITLGRGKRGESLTYAGRYFVLFALCLAVLCAGMCCERFLTPQLFRIAIEKLKMFF